MISVIVPVYKAEAYLSRCIDSILGQTYSQLEVILVDDGSPDGCGAICDAYAEKDSRIKVIHQKNQGASVARNAGLELSTGDWIAFVDADDFISADMYGQMLAVAERMNADLVETTYRYGKWENEDTGKTFRYTGKEATLKIFQADRFGDGICVSPCTKLFRRSAIGALRFLPGCTSAEDALFVVSFLCQNGVAIKLDKTFYTYYLSEDSAMRSQYSIRRCDEVEANRQMVSVAQQCSFDTLHRLLCSRYLGLLTHHWVQCYRHPEADFQQKAKQLRAGFLEDYPKLSPLLSAKEKVKYSLFRYAPKLYYLLRRPNKENAS